VGSGTDFFNGVVINEETMPGGDGFPWNLGYNLVHQVGHWLGLYHTFQNGCSDPGDYVSDAAPEAEAAYECIYGRDTCRGGGLDPITNYMDFTEDSCLTGFTTQQRLRMVAVWNRYRSTTRPRPYRDSSRTDEIL
jgi:hypothetical protein